MKSLRLTLRLAVAFCLLAAVLVIVGWQGISHLRQLDAQMQHIIRDRWDEQLLSHQAYRLSSENGQLTWLIFLLDDPAKIQQSLVQRAANSQRITELVQNIEPRLDPGKEKQLFAAVQAARTPYLESYQRALSLLLTEHKREAARQMMVDVVRPSLTAYHQAWGVFNQFQVEEINQAMRQSQVEFATGQRNFLLVLAVAGWLAGAIAIFTIQRMNREIAVSQRAEQSLQEARDRLEGRVTERTAELATVNKILQVENAERQRVEATLWESEERLRSLIENARDAIFTIATDGTFTSLNPAVAAIAGVTRAEWIGQPFAPMVHPDDLPLAREMFQRVLKGEQTPVHELRGHPGLSRPALMEMTLAAQKDGHGKIIGVLGVGRDITDRKRLEARLFQSQKMETVGKLAGGIAHEFNSILTAIIGQSELLRADLPAGSPLSANAAEISQAANRAATLTRQLLAYGRKQLLQPEALDLNQVLVGLEETLRHLMTAAAVEVNLVPTVGLRLVQADAGQIEQVIINLVLNANDAMPNGGQLTLETANISFDQDSAGRYPELKPGDYVRLAISDTGRGMSETVKAHAFEPFFTTKGVGLGTGLGLSTCYGIVKQSGGHISVYSELGRGTTFKIYLPQVAAPAPVPVPRLNAPDLPRGRETILLVEDDPALREMAATWLRRLGYTVLAAANGVEALSLKHEPGAGHIHLLFTDVVMPHMSGKELADRVRALYPHTRILFTSAYTEIAMVHQGVLDQGVALLQKPFTPSALARKIRELLDPAPI